jgi:plastocyanin
MKDKKILKELRNGPMKNMKDDEYSMIEEEVNQKGIAGLKGYAKSIVEKAMRDMAYDMKKAVSVSTGDMVSWNSSGGSASGKVVRVISSGKINVPDSSFSIEGTEDDPAALIQLYRDGKPTETKVGHKVSTLKKN